MSSEHYSQKYQKKILIRNINSSNKLKLSLDDIYKLLGEKKDSNTRYIKYKKLFYQIPLPTQIDTFLLDYFNFINSKFITKSGTYKKYLAWEKGWKFNLNRIKRNFNIKFLTPKFVRKDQLLRINGKYIIPKSSNFETKLFQTIKLIIFYKYIKNINYIYEFGCGTGHNLIFLSKHFKNLKFIGTDYSRASQNILNIVNKRFSNINGFFFDITKPSKNFYIKKNSIIFTVGTMEQVGKKYRSFFKFLRKNKPNIIIHFETFNELYSNYTITDYLTKKYLNKRNYLKNYLSFLRDKEKKKIIKITKVQRIFGNQFHEGYSCVIYKFVN
jgi:SAM-dependent methyltransferase